MGLLFPPRCVLCGALLEREEPDLCGSCREEVREYPGPYEKHPCIAKWVCLWYYKDRVRAGILQFKFHGHRSRGRSFGRLLAMKVLREELAFDLVTWVPVSFPRLVRRGYDQSRLLAQSLAGELGCKAHRTLIKRRSIPPQSLCPSAAARRANVRGAFRPDPREDVRGKRILLIDDILTTGATAGECARTLLQAGAKSVVLAVLATPEQQS